MNQHVRIFLSNGTPMDFYHLDMVTVNRDVIEMKSHGDSTYISLNNPNIVYVEVAK